MRVLDHDLTKVSSERLEDIQRTAIKMLTVQQALESVATALVQTYDKSRKIGPKQRKESWSGCGTIHRMGNAIGLVRPCEGECLQES